MMGNICLDVGFKSFVIYSHCYRIAIDDEKTGSDENRTQNGVSVVSFSRKKTESGSSSESRLKTERLKDRTPVQTSVLLQFEITDR